MAHSCTQILSSFLSQKNISIDIDGNIAFHNLEYQTCIIFLISVILTVIILLLLIRIPYYPVTLISDSIYSNVVSYCLNTLNIPYLVCTSGNSSPLYKTSTNLLIPFSNPIIPNNISKCFPVIPTHTDDLSSHTNLTNIESIQTQLLNLLPSHINLNPFLEIHNNPIGIITHITKLFDNFYLIETSKHKWLTRLIISDSTSSLTLGDIITGLHGNIQSSSDDVYSVTSLDNSYEIIIPPHSISIYKSDLYKVDELFIHPISDVYHSCESTLYSLKIPRPFYRDSIYTLHPFHFPQTYDPFFTIILLTLSLVKSSFYTDL